MNRLALVLGLAAGYVLGTRAGREKYEEITDQAQKLWGDPRVQDQVAKVKDQAPVLKEKAAEAAKTAAAKAPAPVRGAAESAANKLAEGTSTETFGTDAGTTSYGTTTYSTGTTAGTSTYGQTSGFDTTTSTDSFGPGTDRI